MSHIMKPSQLTQDLGFKLLLTFEVNPNPLIAFFRSSRSSPTYREASPFG
jgi:hypothetical protein